MNIMYTPTQRLILNIARRAGYLTAAIIHGPRLWIGRKLEEFGFSLMKRSSIQVAKYPFQCRGPVAHVGGWCVTAGRWLAVTAPK
jgi:hypothetical protein